MKNKVAKVHLVLICAMTLIAQNVCAQQQPVYKHRYGQGQTYSQQAKESTYQPSTPTPSAPAYQQEAPAYGSLPAKSYAPKNPFYRAQKYATESISGLASPITSAAASAQQAAASGWNYTTGMLGSGWEQGKTMIGSMRGGLGTFRQWVKPSETALLNARKRIQELESLEALKKTRQLNGTEQTKLAQLKQGEYQDRALVATWWPYIMGAGALALLAWYNPEEAKNLLYGTTSLVGTGLKTAGKGIGYAGSAAGSAIKTVGGAALSKTGAALGAAALAGAVLTAEDVEDENNGTEQRISTQQQPVYYGSENYSYQQQTDPKYQPRLYPSLNQ